MISEEEAKKQLEQLELITDFKDGKRRLPLCGFCCHYKVNIRQVDKDTGIAECYCNFTGKGVAQSDSCEKFNEKTSSWEKENKAKNEYLKLYVEPLEYVGIISRVLESPPNNIRLLMREKIDGMQVMVNIYMENDSHWVDLRVVYAEPSKHKRLIGTGTYFIPGPAKCKMTYAIRLEETIKNAFDEIKERISKEE